MSIVAAHPELAIWGAIIIALCLTAYGILRLTGETGQHARARQFERDLDAAASAPAPQVHHDEYLTAPPPDGFTGHETVTIPKGLRYRYGTLGDNGPAPFEKELGLIPPSLHDGFRAALAMTKRAEDESDISPGPPRSDLRITENEIAIPASPPDSPAAEVGTADTRDGDPVAVAGDPGPDGAPEGDGQAARPPQGTARPGDLLENAPGAPMVAGEIPARPLLVSAHETAAPGDLLAKAVAAIAALPVSDYLDEVDRTAAYDGDAPWNPFSDATLTRIQAIKAEVA